MIKRSLPAFVRLFALLALVSLCLGLTVPMFLPGPSAQATGQKIWVQDSRPLAVTYTGPGASSAQLPVGVDTAAPQPVAMVQGDFDQDGFADLAVGFSAGGNSFIAIHRGNIDAFAPQSNASFQAIARGEFPSPFLSQAKTFAVPVSPDFIATGDFTGHNGADLAVAARGDSTVYIFEGDGKGNFTPGQIIPLPGAITSLGAGQLGRVQMFSKLIVGVSGPQQSFLAVYGGGQQGMAPLAAFPLTAPAGSISFGEFGDIGPDAAFLSGGQVVLLHSSSMTLETLSLPVNAQAMALGSFIYDRLPGLQIAVLDTNGSIAIAAHSEFDPRVFTVDEMRSIRQARRSGLSNALITPPFVAAHGWKIVESVPSAAPFSSSQPPLLFRARVSSQGADDVMVLNGSMGQMAVVSHADPIPGASNFLPAQLSTRPYSGSPVAAIAARVNIDGRPGVLALHQGEMAPRAMMPLPDPIFTVNRNDDPVPVAPITNACNGVANDCSLREAVLRANATPGTDTIMVPAGTFTLSQPRSAGTPAYDANTGTLDITDSINIIGAGQNLTIIQAGTTGFVAPSTPANGVDMLMAVNEDLPGFTNATASISNLTLQNGHNRGNDGTTQDGDAGCLEFDTGGTGNNTLTLTNVTIQNCDTTKGEGGGIAIFNSNRGAGAVTITNSIIQNNSTTDTLAVGTGGGIWVAEPGQMTMSNSQVINNFATDVNGPNAGTGGGITTTNVDAGDPVNTIHSSTISGNKAAGQGGGIKIGTKMVIDQGTVISNNSAGSANVVNQKDGGGIFSDLSINTDTVTLTKLTITGNSAPNGSGGAIFNGSNSGGGSMSISLSRMAGNTASVANNLDNDDTTVTATNNWWGTNTPATTINTTGAGGATTFDPFIVLSNTAAPNLIKVGVSSTVIASFLQDNHGTAIPVANLTELIGLPVPPQSPLTIFPDTPVHGTLSAVQTTIQANGQATETFTATSGGIETVHAAVDQASVPATITVLFPPSIAKAFSVTHIPVGGTATLTFTITNINTANALNGLAFSDSLPAGLVVATPPNVADACAGAVTAAAGTGTISLSGGTVGINTTCTVAVDVKGVTDGVQNNTSGNVTATDAGGLTGNTASASITVINPPTIVKAFGAASIPINGATSLTFTLTSTNANLTLNGVAFTDSLPATLVVATPNGLSTTCSGTATAVAGTGTVSLTGATLAPGASCTVTVNVTSNSPGVKNNSVTGTSTDVGGLTGNTSNASLTVVAPPVIVKAFGAASIPLNGSTTLTFTIQNINTTTTLTSIGFSDTLPAGLVVSTPNGLTAGCQTVAGAVSTAGTATATAGGNTISLSGLGLNASGSCSFSVNVTGTTAGQHNNTTGNVTSTEGGTGGTASASIIVVAPPSIAKAFGAAAIPLNGTTSLTFTITNPAANTVAENGVAFNDTLPAGLVVATPNGLANSCGGTATATAGSTAISLTGASIATPGTTCTVVVNITGTASGLYTNTTGAVSSTNGGTGNTAIANLTVASAPTITKAFGAAAIPLNGTTSLTFTIQNPNAGVALTGVAFTDNLPAGLVVATPNGLSSTCGGTATATAGAASASLSAGTLAASASCTVSLNVTGTTSGVKNNSVQVTSTEGGTGNTSNASLTVVSPPVIIKAFGAASIPLNGSTTLTFTIQNINATTTLTGIGFSDTLPAGLVVSTPNGLTAGCQTVAGSVSTAGTATATAGGNTISLSGLGLNASGSCSFSVNVTGTTAGQHNNTTGNVTSTEGGTGGTASASIIVVAPPSIAKAFGAAAIPLNGTTSLTFTITNPAANTVAENGVAFNDTLPAGLVVATPNGLANSCGGTATATAGSTAISLTGASIATPGTTCTVAVNITGTASGLYTNTTGSVSSTNGGTGNTATANLTVASPPTITKAFGAANIPLNGATSLTFTIQNPNGTVPLSGVAFTDNFPSGLVVATPNNLNNTCGGTATAIAGTPAVSLSAGTLATSASCTVSVNVQGTSAGVKNNSVQVTSTEGGTGNTSNASITVVGPPVIIKAFGAASVPLNGSTTLQFTIQNNNATQSLSGVAFSDTLPAGLVVSTPNGLSGSCGAGTVTATQGGNTISLSAGTIAASSSCTFTVNVTGTTAGQQNNTTGQVTSTEGGTGGTASASLAVVAPPSIAKVFNPNPIALNATSSLTFTITNPAANTVAELGVAFSDTLPVGLTVANGTATVCGGTLTTSTNSTIALVGATIATSGQCQFSVTVTGAAAGQYTNTTGSVTSTNGGTGNTATANLTVAAPPTITKSFGAANIPLNGATSLTFNIQNPNSSVALSGVAFTDNLPAGLVVATPNGLSNTCGGTATATAGASSLSLSAGTLATSASCTVSVNVQGTTAGVKNNSVQVTSTEGGTGNTSNASITVVAPPVIIKAFGAASVPLNGSTTLTFTIQNNNATQGLTGVGFSDTLPAGLVVSTPNGLSGSCGAGTITATQGGNTISLSGGTIAASSSCTFTVNVTGTAAGQQNNTTGNVTSTEGGTGGTASASLAVVAPPSIAKVFNPNPIALNTTTSLTFTITNPAANTVAENGVAFNDTLPAGLTVASASGAICGGTLTTTNPTSIALAGATIATGGQCQFSVTVTGAVSGLYTNTTGSVTSTNGGTGNTATANLTVAAPPTITKSFGAAAIPLNGATSLTFNIQNPNSSVALSGLAFTDNLPAGLVVATPNNLNNTCGGTATATAGASSLSLSAGTLATSASCTVSVNVQGTSAGVKNNSVQVTSTEGGTGNTSNASITVVGPPVIIKAFGAASVPLNGSTTLQFTIQNNNATQGLTGVGFSDTLPAGLVVSTPNGLSGSCGAGTITATQGGNVISLSGGTIAASSSCTFTVNVTGTAAGQQNNTTGNVTSTEGGTGGTASASLAVVAPPSIVKAFNPNGIPLNGTSTLTFTITNPAANSVAEAGVAFTDNLPAGLVVATPNGLSNTCGGTPVATAGSGSISLTGGTVATSSNCTLAVNIAATQGGVFTNTSGAVSSTNGGTGNTASDTLTVAAPPTIAKSFSASAVGVGATIGLNFTIVNSNASVTLTGIAFTDTLPAGLVVATPNNLNSTCGGTATAVAGSSNISLTGGAVDPGPPPPLKARGRNGAIARTGATTRKAGTNSNAAGFCTINVSVQAVTVGTKNNITGAVSANESGPGVASNTATVEVIQPPTATKAFGAASVPLNGTTSLTFTLSNPTATTTFVNTSLTDVLPAGLVVATPNGLVDNCSSATLANPGSNTIAIADVVQSPGASCTIAVNVQGTTGGIKNNTTGNVMTTFDDGTGTFIGINGGTASASITVLAPDLTIAKSHSGNFTQGDVGDTYTITVNNVGGAATSGTVTVTDAAPAFLIPTAIGGTGWTCPTLTSCNRSDALPNGNSYPAITFTVSVAVNAPPSLTNSVTVSGGSETNTANDTATDPTTINQLPGPPLTIALLVPSTQTIKSGNSAQFVFDVVSHSATLGNINFACSGLPAGAACNFTPQTENQGDAQVTMTMTTTPNAGLAWPSGMGKSGPVYAALLFPVLGLLSLTAAGRRGKKNRMRLVMFLGGFVVLMALFGCGGTPHNGTPLGAFPVTVTATSAANPTVTASTQVVVTVQ